MIEHTTECWQINHWLKFELVATGNKYVFERFMTGMLKVVLALIKNDLVASGNKIKKRTRIISCR
jgi:hypothetical protein